MPASDPASGTAARRLSALTAALEPVARFLADDRVVEILLNADGAVWVQLDMHASRAYSACMAGRQRKETAQYTIRNVPKIVDRALRRRARRTERSLNEVALEALARGAGVEGEPVQHHDLDFLFGSWIEDPAVDQALADQRTVDPSLWK